MFQTSQLCIINKIDLLPYVKFDLENVKKYARRINPAIQFIELSCTSGEGTNNWYAWLKKEAVEQTPIVV
jgi:hydrogenase nickel incorporation protein HypB